MCCCGRGRSRTAAFVFAPAQWGEHAGGRRSYGHSLIVDPWGEVLADGGEETGIVTARIDPARVAEARRIGAVADARPRLRAAGAGLPSAGRRLASTRSTDRCGAPAAAVLVHSGIAQQAPVPFA